MWKIIEKIESILECDFIGYNTSLGHRESSIPKKTFYRAFQGEKLLLIYYLLLFTLIGLWKKVTFEKCNSTHGCHWKP